MSPIISDVISNASPEQGSWFFFALFVAFAAYVLWSMYDGTSWQDLIDPQQVRLGTGKGRVTVFAKQKTNLNYVLIKFGYPGNTQYYSVSSQDARELIKAIQLACDKVEGVVA
jgi:hypothetical protein